MPNIEPLRRQVQAKIRKLELRASSGLWILTLFTALSLAAYREFDFLPPLSDELRSALGAGPPVDYINWALVLYGFSAIIIVLTQMTGSKPPGTALSHFGYLSAFYAFYYFSNGLADNFWAIFTIGMTILSLQSYHIWNHYREQIRGEEEILAELDKLLED